MPRNLEHVSIFKNKTVNENGLTALGVNSIPMAHGWFKANLVFKIALTVGTASGAVTNGELDLIKNITLRTDLGEVICDLPGRALYEIALTRAFSVPNKDAIAASSATYRVNIPIHFADMNMARPEDTILDTSRYNDLNIDVTLGSVSDLFTTPGTATIAVTCDLEVLRTANVLPPEGKPIAFVSFTKEPVADPNSTTEINIQRNANRSIKRLFVLTTNSATAGSAFSGTAENDVIETFSLADHNAKIIKDRDWASAQDELKDWLALENLRTGLVMIDFVREGVHSNALYTGNLSQLQFTWDNDATVAANDQVSIATESINQLIRPQVA